MCGPKSKLDRTGSHTISLANVKIRQSSRDSQSVPDSKQGGNATIKGDVSERSATPSSLTASSIPGVASNQSDRIALAKEKALKRVQDRMATAGIKPASDTVEETLAQRQEREKHEREERIKRAEAEDVKREQERQQRLARESDTAITGPSSEVPAPTTKPASKKPPPPPTRKVRQESADFLAERRAAESTAKAKAEEEAAEEIKQEQQTQQAERQRIE